VIYYDRYLIPKSPSSWRTADAERIYVGKAPLSNMWPQKNHADLGDVAKRGQRVRAPKCGDPGVFDAATEEMMPQSQRIDFALSPGTAACATASKRCKPEQIGKSITLVDDRPTAKMATRP